MSLSFFNYLIGDTNDVAIGSADIYLVLGWANTDGSGTGASATYPKHTAYTSGRVNFMSNGTSGGGGGGGQGVGGEDPTGPSFSGEEKMNRKVTSSRTRLHRDLANSGSDYRIHDERQGNRMDLSGSCR